MKLVVEADGFAPLRLQQVKVEIDRTIRLSLGLVITGTESVDVSAVAETVDRDSNTLGQTVTERQITDLPLNGRNFTQLGSAASRSSAVDERAYQRRRLHQSDPGIRGERPAAGVEQLSA